MREKVEGGEDKEEAEEVGGRLCGELAVARRGFGRRSAGEGGKCCMVGCTEARSDGRKEKLDGRRGGRLRWCVQEDGQ